MTNTGYSARNHRLNIDIYFYKGRFMKKLVLSIFAAVAMMSSALAAELHFGISAQMVDIEADGTETEGGENNSGSASHTVPVGSIFAEITSGRFTLGVDYIPMGADVSDVTKKRTDTETSVTGEDAAVSTTGNGRDLGRTKSRRLALCDRLIIINGTTGRPTTRCRGYRWYLNVCV